MVVGSTKTKQKSIKRKRTNRAVHEQCSVKHHKTVPAKSSAGIEALILCFWLQGLHRAFPAGLAQPGHDP